MGRRWAVPASETRPMVPLHPLDEGGEAVEARAERRDPLKLVDDDAEVVEHVVERAGRLGDHAELDAARKVERRDDEDGQDLHEVRVRRREELEVPLRAEDRAPVGDRAAQPALHLRRLLRLALVEGDALRILAQPHERVAQVGLAEQLLGVLADERAAEVPGGERAEAGVREDRVEELRDGVVGGWWVRWRAGVRCDGATARSGRWSRGCPRRRRGRSPRSSA